MTRIDLQVPLNEKDEAERLGARWDSAQKVWYVPANVDPTPLHRWHCQTPAPNIRARSYFLATTTRECWRCAALTRVVAIALSEEHEEFYVGDDPADDHWQEAAMPVLLTYIMHLSETLAASLRRSAPHYRKDFSRTTESLYWMNHCEHCAAKLGDFSTNQEHGVGFSAWTTEQAAAISLEQICETFAARCGSYATIEWFAHARHSSTVMPPSA